MSNSSKSRVRPLIVRPGARFTCFGDGLCCTDIHLLGPLTRAEAGEVRDLSPEAVVYNRDEDELVLKPVSGGRCFFLRKSGCEIHTERGIEAKPTGCDCSTPGSGNPDVPLLPLLVLVALLLLRRRSSPTA